MPHRVTVMMFDTARRKAAMCTSALAATLTLAMPAWGQTPAEQQMDFLLYSQRTEDVQTYLSVSIRDVLERAKERFQNIGPVSGGISEFFIPDGNDFERIMDERYANPEGVVRPTSKDLMDRMCLASETCANDMPKGYERQYFQEQYLHRIGASKVADLKKRQLKELSDFVDSNLRRLHAGSDGSSHLDEVTARAVKEYVSARMDLAQHRIYLSEIVADLVDQYNRKVDQIRKERTSRGLTIPDISLRNRTLLLRGTYGAIRPVMVQTETGKTEAIPVSEERITYDDGSQRSAIKFKFIFAVEGKQPLPIVAFVPFDVVESEYRFAHDRTVLFAKLGSKRDPSAYLPILSSDDVAGLQDWKCAAMQMHPGGSGSGICGAGCASPPITVDPAPVFGAPNTSDQ